MMLSETDKKYEKKRKDYNIEIQKCEIYIVNFESVYFFFNL